MAASRLPAHYASADEPTLRGDRTWLEQQWDIARLKAAEGKSGALRVLDEIQKITDWPNVAKLLWDANRRPTGCSERMAKATDFFVGIIDRCHSPSQ
jgi:hypothetical protein